MRPKARKYDREKVCADIFADMRNGLSALKACKKNGLPQSCLNDWLNQDPQLAAEYARAREELHDFIAGEILQIADQPPPLTPDGKVDNGAVQAMRLQVDTRKWLLSKLAPKRYGERVALAADDESPLQVGINVNFVKPNG